MHFIVVYYNDGFCFCSPEVATWNEVLERLANSFKHNEFNLSAERGFWKLAVRREE